MKDILNWYAIQVRPRREISTAQVLGGKGFNSFVPVYKNRRIWSDRKVDIDLPLFPGYVFCRFDLRLRLPIVTTPNILRIVSAGKVPLPIEDSEIEAVQKIVLSKYQAKPYPFLTAGTRVLIEKGPLSGLCGIVKGYKNRYLILSIGVLQQSICMDLNDDILTVIHASPDAGSSVI
jgi:transcription termination/antitermination protein NusG